MSKVVGKVSITPRGAWNATTTYSRLDVVHYNGNAYISKNANSATVPTDGETWMLLGTKGDQGQPGGETPEDVLIAGFESGLIAPASDGNNKIYTSTTGEVYVL